MLPRNAYNSVELKKLNTMLGKAIDGDRKCGCFEALY